MVGVGVALAVSAALTLVLIELGPALGYVDRPDDPALKAHTRPAVPLGGVAIFVAVHLGLVIIGRFDAALLAASAILLLLGLTDDRIGLSPVVRLIVTTAAGIVIAWGSENLGVAVFSVALVVITVNAVNLFDGLDGLAGSAGAVSALAAAGLAAVVGQEIMPGLVVGAALAGFLVFNWHPARAFLGDNGAYVLALLLVWLIAETGETVGELAATSGILGVFIVDLLVTVLRRWRSGAPLFAGDRSHIYDRLHQSGLGVPTVSLISSAAQVVLAGITLLIVWWLPTGLAFAAVAVVGLGVVALLTFGGLLPASVETG